MWEKCYCQVEEDRDLFYTAPGDGYDHWVKSIVSFLSYK